MDKGLKKLFKTKHPYDEAENLPYFLQAEKNTVAHWIQTSDFYKEVCCRQEFEVGDLTSVEHLYRIPVIPTLFFKRNDVARKHNGIIEVTSSGTSGKVSRVSYSVAELLLMARMAIRLGRVHKLFSWKPTHYIVLGYQPSRKNKMVISKTAYLSTWYAPGISRTYALQYRKGAYQLKLDALLKKVVHCSKGRWPVRVIGFPSYLYFLLQKMKEENRECILPKGSAILLGGGWKQFSTEEIPKETLYKLIKEVLGVGEENIHEFFGAAEHPVLYCTCKHHHFHIPVYAKVLIRDVNTLQPLSNGEVGLVNLITPIRSSIPLTSIMTDDLGVVHDGKTCGCGIETDYLEIIGRVGVKDIKTCSAGAADFWRGSEHATN